MSKKLAAAPLVLVVLTASDQGAHWSYSGATSPAHWEGTCHTGKAQSPIAISTAATKSAKLPPLSFSYRPGPLHIVDNGHTVSVDVPNGSTLTVGGVRFPLVQYHFHKPSEEVIDGHHFAMVAHLVHRDAEGHLAVVAVPFQPGAANPAIASLWKNVPREKGYEASPAGVVVDPAQLLPRDHAYFTYVGSLTTPPCTEGVRWFVLKSPATMSPEQIAAFGKLYAGNARPIQSINKREVLAAK